MIHKPELYLTASTLSLSEPTFQAFVYFSDHREHLIGVVEAFFFFTNILKSKLADCIV